MNHSHDVHCNEYMAKQHAVLLRRKAARRKTISFFAIL